LPSKTDDENSDSRFYREAATRVRERASQTADPELQGDYLALAAAYEELANTVGTPWITSSPKRVVKLGMDAGGLTSEQTLQQPAVIDLLQQSRLALWGCILLGLGFFFQFGGTF
jgi:hypothetical protein